MDSGLPCVLTISCGSSSIRFAVYEASETPRQRIDGRIDRIGFGGTNVIVKGPAGPPQLPRRTPAADHRKAAAGHRVVHGMKHSQPERIAKKLLGALRRISPYDPGLGNGASLAAVRDGRSIDISTGFPPTSGLVMSTRTGDLDPGLVYYMARTEGMTAAHSQKMVNHESGLVGVSGTS